MLRARLLSLLSLLQLLTPRVLAPRLKAMAERGLVYQTMASWKGDQPLDVDDPEVYEIIRKEKVKQKNGIVLVASEVSVLTENILKPGSFSM